MSFDLCAVDIVLVGIYARMNETEPREHSKDDRWASAFWLTPHTVVDTLGGFGCKTRG
jgi:hypothetical protein